MTNVPTTASEKTPTLSAADRRYNAFTVCLCLFVSLFGVLIVLALFSSALASTDDPGVLEWSLLVISLVGTVSVLLANVMSVRDWRTTHVPESAPKAWRDLTLAEWQEGVRRGRP